MMTNGFTSLPPSPQSKVQREQEAGYRRLAFAAVQLCAHSRASFSRDTGINWV